jgi:hypothetical protein
MHKIEDLTVKKFGRLTVTKYVGIVGKNNEWLCVCECGTPISVSVSHLNNNHTRSCGCLQKETNVKRLTTHNSSRKGRATPEYNA